MRRVEDGGRHDPVTRARILQTLRRDPSEWARRGLLSPAQVERIVAERLGTVPFHADPTYADFLGPSAAEEATVPPSCSTTVDVDDL